MRIDADRFYSVCSGFKGMDRYVSASEHDDKRDEAVDASRHALNQLHSLLKRIGLADPNLKVRFLFALFLEYVPVRPYACTDSAALTRSSGMRHRDSV